jgi:signal transduction histidine kinase
MAGSDSSSEEGLRASRARLLATSDSDRRELEQALHDGVQQDLVALGVNLQLVRDLTDSDPPAAQALLDEMRRDVHAALEGVRTLAERIYPQLLPSRGLSDALRAAASAAGVSISVDARRIARYPAAVEAAVYFCCRAALESAGPNATASIRHHVDSLGVEIVIEESRYEPPDHLRDRVDALRGRLELETMPGAGTRLTVVVPLYEPSAAR